MAFTSFDTLHELSRVWIYRSSRVLTDDEVTKVKDGLRKFSDQWTAHNQTLNAHATVHHNRFITIFLDEHSSSQASGCSIDSQVRFVKDIGNALNVDFFDRLHFDFVIDGEIQSIHKDDVKGLIESGDLSNDSTVLDHLVKSKSEFLSRWQKPLSESWHARLI